MVEVIPTTISTDSDLKDGAREFFEIKRRVELDSNEALDIVVRFYVGNYNYFAAVVKNSGNLLLITDGPVEEHWVLKCVPWFEDDNKRITSLVFDLEANLYIGTNDGEIYELCVPKLHTHWDKKKEDKRTAVDLRKILSMPEPMSIDGIVVHMKENSKIILCFGPNARFVIIDVNFLPALITFNHPILGINIFINRTGLACVMISLESGQNIFTILDDIETTESITGIGTESAKKSIFRKAKDTIISKFSSSSTSTDEKTSIFHRKKNESTIHSNNSANSIKPSSVLSTLTFENDNLQKPALPISNIKFHNVDDPLCIGLLKKIQGRNEFYRHFGNKMDVFDGEFRQIQAIFVPNYIKQLYPINNIYFGVDEENKCIRAAIIHNGMMKEYAIFGFSEKIISIIPYGDVENAPYSVFIISDRGIYDMNLNSGRIESCVELLFNDSLAPLFDIFCSALLVKKNEAYIIAGDLKSEEGKYAKSVLYYRLAGLTHAKILAKLGSKDQMSALLFFSDLIEMEKSRMGGSYREKRSIADIVLLARIERYLRLGFDQTNSQPRNPKIILSKFILENIYYSTNHASKSLCHPHLLWALRLLGKARLCYPEIIASLYENRSNTEIFTKYEAFWSILYKDWMTIFNLKIPVFQWLKNTILDNIDEINFKILSKLINLLIPWRRELLRRIFYDFSDVSEIIDFTLTPDETKVDAKDYIELFITLLLKGITKMSPDMKLPLPKYLFMENATKLQVKELIGSNIKPVAEQLYKINYKKLFCASSTFCACVRNGKALTWGENKLGKLGIGDEINKLSIDYPTSISLVSSLKIPIVSISCGQNHVIALTQFGTILVWGSNFYGQLGVGRQTVFTGRPYSLDIPDLIFIGIAAGGYHSLAIDHLHRVWSWGWGVHGQLGHNQIENLYKPHMITLEDKVVHVAAGHSHSAILTDNGRVLTFGCAHFGQLGHGSPQVKEKIPKVVNLPSGIAVKRVECGTCSTIMLSMKNHLYYMGLNPATMKSFLSGKKKNHSAQEQEELKDYNIPRLFDTTQVGGDIIKIDASTTHFGILTSLGIVYTWGIGKSGQLARPDDDSRTLELIECDDKILLCNDVACGGDATFVIDKENGRLFGSGFNSNGQLGKMENEDEGTTITLRAKKKIIKLRQPSNIYFRLRELYGLPKNVNQEVVASGIPKLNPPRHFVDQEIIEWILKTFFGYYNSKNIVQVALDHENYEAASLIESLDENHDNALKYTLKTTKDKEITENAISSYLHSNTNTASLEQSIRFLRLLIGHWKQSTNLSGCDLENILQKHVNTSPWDYFLSSAITDVISASDESSSWISANFTPVFILSAIKESQNESTSEGKLHLDLVRKNASSVDSYSNSEGRGKENGGHHLPLLCPINRFSDDDEIDI